MIDGARDRVRRAFVMGLAALALAALAAVALPSMASAQPQPYGANNYDTFYNILPPGQNGFDNLSELAQYKANGSRPAHNDDQLGMYHALTSAAPNVKSSQITNY